MSAAARRALLGLAALATLIGAALFGAPAASAHATVVSSSPQDGARLRSAPSTVTITFDEPVGLDGFGYLRVVDQAGRRVDIGSASHPGGNGAVIAVRLASGLRDGTYTASFRIVSADSHPVAGTVRFVVGNAILGAAAPPPTVDGATGAAFDAVRWIGFGGVALLGGGWLLLTVWPAGLDDRAARRLVWAGWTAAVAGALGETLLQGPYAAGSTLGALSRWSLLDATLHTTFGTAHSIRLVLLGVLGGVIVLLLRDLRRTRLAEVSGLLMVGVLVTYATSGHAGTQHPRWLAIASDSLHVAAMAAWVGGLAYLAGAVLPRRDAGELRTVLPVFSRVAFGSVCVLAVTGGVQAWLGVGSLDALTSTRYGQLVLVKAALFAALLGLGDVSRIAIQRRYVRPVAYAMSEARSDLVSAVEAESAGPPLNVRRMRRSVLAELAIGAAVLAVTAVLVAEPPGAAAEATAHSAARQTTIQLGGGRSAAVVVDPGRHGPVTITVTLSGGPAPLGLTATAALPAKELGPIPLPLSPDGPGSYAASGVLLPAAGDWEIDLDVRTSQFDSTTADGHVRLY